MLNFIIRYIANKFATWKNLQFFNRIGQFLPLVINFSESVFDRNQQFLSVQLPFDEVD
jgi:hypothetical protein